jgi:hypothetical protein
MSKTILMTAIFAFVFLLAGIIHLVYANKIARFYRRLYPDDGFLKLFFPFRFWMEVHFT